MPDIDQWLQLGAYACLILLSAAFCMVCVLFMEEMVRQNDIINARARGIDLPAEGADPGEQAQAGSSDPYQAFLAAQDTFLAGYLRSGEEAIENMYHGGI